MAAHGTLAIASSPNRMNLLNTSPQRGLLETLRRLPIVLLRVLLGLVGLVFTLGLVAIGLVAGAVLIAWALLRGRRPQGLKFDVRRGPVFDAGGWRRPAAGADVVDVEAREVVEPPIRR